MSNSSQDAPPAPSESTAKAQGADRTVRGLGNVAPNAPLNPYPGLRPFRYDSTVDESIIFKGRSRQVQDLLKRLSDSHLVAVVGPSGCGKSSLVLAGLIPELESGHIYEAGSDWRSASMRPGLDALGAMAKTLAQALAKDGVAPEGATEEWTSILNDGQNGLIEFHRRYQRAWGEDTNLLLVIDQFEELFRSDRSSPHDANQLVGLILNVFQVRPKCLYVVITMRTDYYEHCALFMGLPEALNKTQFLTPRLNRSDLQEAIEIPPSLFRGRVQPDLRDQIMRQMREEVGYDPDRLPLMQHVLMWMWNRAKEDGSDSIELTLEDYKQVTGLRRSLSKHADQIYEGLSESQKETAKIMFRLMGDIDEGGRVRRRITNRQEICDFGGNNEDIDAVTEAFGCETTCFLRANSNDTWDVTHECFIRQWNRLRGWVEEENNLKREFLALADAHATKKAGKRALLDDYEIARFNAQKMNWTKFPQWGERYRSEIEKYSSSYKESLAFLDESAGKRKKQKDMRARAYGLAFAVMTGLAIFGWAQQQIAANSVIEANEARDTAEQQRKIAESEKTSAEKEKLLAIANAFSKEARHQSYLIGDSDAATLMALESYRHLVRLGDWRDTTTICKTVKEVFAKEDVKIGPEDMLSWFCETRKRDSSGKTPEERLIATTNLVCDVVNHNMSLGQWYEATSRDLGTFQVTCPNVLDGVYIHALERFRHGFTKNQILQELDKAAEQSDKFRAKLGTNTHWRWDSSTVVNHAQTLYLIWRNSSPDRLEAHGGQMANYMLKKWIFPQGSQQHAIETYSASQGKSSNAYRLGAEENGKLIFQRMSP